MTDQADETIVLRYLVDAQEVLEKSKQIREQINALKAEMKKMAADGKAGYADIAKGMIEISKIKMTENVAALRAEIKALTIASKDSGNVFIGASKQMLDDIEDRKAAINSEKQAHAQYVAAVRAGLQEITKETRELEKAQGDAGESAGSLKDNLMEMVKTGLTLAGLGAVLSNIKDYLIEAAQAGKEFAQATFAMVVGIRALQRAGVDITIADVTKQIQSLRKEFGVFATKDLVVGTAAFLNLNRDMGFTKDQLFELQNAIAKLAIINGGAMDEVQRTVALALSSGYTEGLQRLGVSINRVTIAQEAARLGWEGGYTALNEQQRAQATYNLVLQKTAIYMDDVQEYLKTAPGQIDAMNAKLIDQKTVIGEELLPLWLKLLEVLYSVIEVFKEDIFTPFVGFTKDRADFIKMFGQEQGVNDVWMDYWWSSSTKKQEESAKIIEEATREYEELTNRLIEEMGESAFRKLTAEEIWARRTGENTIAGLGDVPVLQTDKLAEDVTAAIDAQLDEIQSALEDFQEGSKEAWEDYQRDLEEMETDHFRRRADLYRDYLRKLSELGRDHQRRMDDLALENERRIDDIKADYERSLTDLALSEANDAANIWANYYNSLASEEAKYRNQQIDAEIKYQETLQRLREGFLLDLEDALQARDARQVLKLIRRYNLEKEQASRAFEQEMERLRRQHEERLAELARQRDERLRQLYAEIEAKRIALELEHRRKLDDEQLRFERAQADEQLRYAQQNEDAERAWQQRKDDEAIRYEQDKLDREARYNQELIDLQAHLDARYEKIATALGEELGYTEEMMEAIRVALNDVLGPGGAAESIYGYYTRMAVNAMNAAAGAISYILALQSLRRSPGTSWWLRNMDSDASNFVTPEDKPIKTGFASGGLAYANKATDVTFGEGGPELAAFVPLKGLSSIPSALSALSKGMGSSSSSGGNMRIELWLDRYLEGRIVDAAVDNVADVVLRRFRQ